MEPLIYQTVVKLVKRFKCIEGTGRIIRLDHAMLAFSGDVIGQVCVEDSAQLLDDEEFSPSWWVQKPCSFPLLC